MFIASKRGESAYVIIHNTYNFQLKQSRMLLLPLLASITLVGCDSAQIGSDQSQTDPHAVADLAPDLNGEPAFGAAFDVAGNWSKCANEGELCVFDGVKSVRYGTGENWSDTIVFESGPLGGVRCELDTSWYGDPAEGVLKECQISDVVDTPTNTGEKGEWSPVQSWPVVSVHASLLPSGQVLTHNATNDDLWPAKSPLTRLWNPASNTIAGIDSRDATSNSEMFCAGFTHLPDGSLLTIGNQPNVSTNYDRNANRFDFLTESWSREADSLYYRYYPAMASLPNGDQIGFAGTRSAAPAEVMRFDGSWKALTGMTLEQNFNYYPWGQTAPDGNLFYAGPDIPMRSIDPSGAGSMTELGARDSVNRNYGSFAMYDVGKILVAGGAQPATNTAVIVDVNSATPSVTPTGSMVHPRRHHDLTILADGSVLATGGYSGNAFTFVGIGNSKYEAEIWDPDTGNWSAMASAQRIRNYHSTAVLLPDGRVMTAGNGMPFNIQTNQANAEIFSPPYLFNKQDGAFSTKAVQSSIACNNNTFGDPISGVVKSCYYVATPSGLPAGATKCADEGGVCTTANGGTVYYGANGEYNSKANQIGAIACTNGNFGDPISGVVKSCYTVADASISPTPPAAATECAVEGGVCTLSTPSTVYYGANTQFLNKQDQTGAVECSNANFGDPIFGVQKRCFSIPADHSEGNIASTLPASAIKCAEENGTCTLPPDVSAVVYYGAATGRIFAERPVISYAPDSIAYSGTFSVESAAASTIEKVHLIKLGSVTHSTNQGQRLVPLSYTVSGNELQVDAPENQNIAPPGYYMLFIVDNKGVPSEASMVQVQQYSSVALIARGSGNAISILPGDNGADGTVQLQGNAIEPDLSMTWDLVPTDSGYFKLLSRSNGYALTENVNGSVNARADISSAAQQWSVQRSELGYLTVQSRSTGQLLNISGASEWVLLPVGYQRIVSVDSGKAIEVSNGSTAPGAGISLGSHSGEANQAFRFVPGSDGYLAIQAAHSDYVIGVRDGSVAPITELEQQTNTADESQQWTVVVQADGTVYLQVRHSQLFMNVLYHSVQDGAPIGQFTDNGGDTNQKWRLVPAASLDPHQKNVSGRAIAAAYVSEWLPYVAASNTIGDTTNGIEALKLSTRGVRTTMDVSYRVQDINGSWSQWVQDNQQAGNPGTPLSRFQANLTGLRADCAIAYRAHVQGRGWQAWTAEDGQAGIQGASLTALQVKVECVGSGFAASSSANNSVNMAPVNNLLANSNFAQGKDNWADCAASTLTSVVTNNTTSENELRVENTGCLYQEFPVTVGKQYELNCRARSEDTQFASMTLQVSDQSYNVLNAEVLPVVSGPYDDYHLSVSAPASGAIGVVTLYAEGVSYFDACSVSEI